MCKPVLLHHCVRCNLLIHHIRASDKNSKLMIPFSKNRRFCHPSSSLTHLRQATCFEHPRWWLAAWNGDLLGGRSRKAGERHQTYHTSLGMWISWVFTNISLGNTQPMLKMMIEKTLRAQSSHVIPVVISNCKFWPSLAMLLPSEFQLQSRIACV